MRWPIGRGVISRMRLGQYTQDESRIFRKSFWCTAMIGACVKLFKVDRSQRALMAILHRLPTADRPACGRSGNVKPCALFSRLHHLSSLRFGVAGAQGNRRLGVVAFGYTLQDHGWIVASDGRIGSRPETHQSREGMSCVLNRVGRRETQCAACSDSASGCRC